MAAFPASKQDSIPSFQWADCHTQLGNAGWEVIFQWQWPLRPCIQGGLPHSQGTSRQPPQGCSVTFPLQERAREPRSLCTVLGSCGQNTLSAHLHPGPWGLNSHISTGKAFCGAASNCLQKHPVTVFFLLPEEEKATSTRMFCHVCSAGESSQA